MEQSFRENRGVDISLIEAVDTYKLVEERLRGYRIGDLVMLEDGVVIRSYSDRCSFIVSFNGFPENFRNIDFPIIYLHADEPSDLEKLARICELPFDEIKVEDL